MAKAAPRRKQPKGAHQRKPIGAREIQIIKRLKKVIKLPVTTIALAVERHKKSIYKALKDNAADS